MRWKMLSRVKGEETCFKIITNLNILEHCFFLLVETQLRLNFKLLKQKKIREKVSPAPIFTDTLF